jgi:hypothetical protein
METGVVVPGFDSELNADPKCKIQNAKFRMQNAKSISQLFDE